VPSAAAPPHHVEGAAVVPVRWSTGARGAPVPLRPQAAGPGPAMTAAVGRDLDAEAGAAGAPVDLEELRRVLYRDMLAQLRSELERGA
jgi:hypothetical protein